MQCDMFAPAHPHAELQAIQAIQPVDALPIDHPPLTPEQHPDSHVAKPRAGLRQIADTQPQGGLIFGTALSVPRRPTELR